MKNLKLSIVLLGLSILFTSNLTAQWNSIRGEGAVVKKEISLDNFDGIGLAIPANVFLTQGSSQKVVIEAQANIIKNIETDVKNGTWKIHYDESVKRAEKVNIYITMADLKKISIAGSGDVSSKGAFKGMGDLAISVAGSGDVELMGDAKNVDVSIAGSGDVKMNGSARNIDVSIAGSGDVNLKALSAQNAEISIAGSGNCKVNVNGSLDVSIVGSGDVYYSGDAKVQSTVRGSGNVNKM